MARRTRDGFGWRRFSFSPSRYRYAAERRERLRLSPWSGLVPPDLEVFGAFLARVRRRLAVKAIVDGAAAGSALAIGVAIVGWFAARGMAWTMVLSVACVVAG